MQTHGSTPNEQTSIEQLNGHIITCSVISADNEMRPRSGDSLPLPSTCTRSLGCSRKHEDYSTIGLCNYPAFLNGANGEFHENTAQDSDAPLHSSNDDDTVSLPTANMGTSDILNGELQDASSEASQALTSENCPTQRITIAGESSLDPNLLQQLPPETPLAIQPHLTYGAQISEASLTGIQPESFLQNAQVSQSLPTAPSQQDDEKLISSLTETLQTEKGALLSPLAELLLGEMKDEVHIHEEPSLANTAVSLVDFIRQPTLDSFIPISSQAHDPSLISISSGVACANGPALSSTAEPPQQPGLHKVASRSLLAKRKRPCSRRITRRRGSSKKLKRFHNPSPGNYQADQQITKVAVPALPDNPSATNAGANYSLYTSQVDERGYVYPCGTLQDYWPPTSEETLTDDRKPAHPAKALYRHQARLLGAVHKLHEMLISYKNGDMKWQDLTKRATNLLCSINKGSEDPQTAIRDYDREESGYGLTNCSPTLSNCESAHSELQIPPLTLPPPAIEEGLASLHQRTATLSDSKTDQLYTNLDATECSTVDTLAPNVSPAALHPLGRDDDTTLEVIGPPASMSSEPLKELVNDQQITLKLGDYVPITGESHVEKVDALSSSPIKHNDKEQISTPYRVPVSPSVNSLDSIALSEVVCHPKKVQFMKLLKQFFSKFLVAQKDSRACTSPGLNDEASSSISTVGVEASNTKSGTFSDDSRISVPSAIEEGRSIANDGTKVLESLHCSRQNIPVPDIDDTSVYGSKNGLSTSPAAEGVGFFQNCSNRSSDCNEGWKGNLDDSSYIRNDGLINSSCSTNREVKIEYNNGGVEISLKPLQSFSAVKKSSASMHSNTSNPSAVEQAFVNDRNMCPTCASTRHTYTEETELALTSEMIFRQVLPPLEIVGLLDPKCVDGAEMEGMNAVGFADGIGVSNSCSIKDIANTASITNKTEAFYHNQHQSNILGSSDQGKSEFKEGQEDGTPDAGLHDDPGCYQASQCKNYSNGDVDTSKLEGNAADQKVEAQEKDSKEEFSIFRSLDTAKGDRKVVNNQDGRAPTGYQSLGFPREQRDLHSRKAFRMRPNSVDFSRSLVSDLFKVIAASSDIQQELCQDVRVLVALYRKQQGELQRSGSQVHKLVACAGGSKSIQNLGQDQAACTKQTTKSDPYEGENTELSVKSSEQPRIKHEYDASIMVPSQQAGEIEASSMAPRSCVCSTTEVSSKTDNIEEEEEEESVWLNKPSSFADELYVREIDDELRQFESLINDDLDKFLTSSFQALKSLLEAQKESRFRAAIKAVRSSKVELPLERDIKRLMPLNLEQKTLLSHLFGVKND